MCDIYLSLVVPCFNEAARLPRSLPVMLAYLQQQEYAWELLLVDDGSSDGTAALIDAAANADPRVRAMHLPHNIGKGGTVKHGLLAAQGKHIFFSDTDLSTPIDSLADGLRLLEQGVEFVYADRHMRGAQLRGYNPLRRVMSQSFNLCARWLLLPGISDTQCGFKGFRRNIIAPLLKRNNETHFAFDVELLVIAREQGWRTQGFPVVWDNVGASKVKPFSDALAMFSALLVIRRRLRAGLYR